jgi:hypothetical protein
LENERKAQILLQEHEKKLAEERRIKEEQQKQETIQKKEAELKAKMQQLE